MDSEARGQSFAQCLIGFVRDRFHLFIRGPRPRGQFLLNSLAVLAAHFLIGISSPRETFTPRCDNPLRSSASSHGKLSDMVLRNAVDNSAQGRGVIAFLNVCVGVIRLMVLPVKIHVVTKFFLKHLE